MVGWAAVAQAQAQLLMELVVVSFIKIRIRYYLYGGRVMTTADSKAYGVPLYRNDYATISC